MTFIESITPPLAWHRLADITPGLPADLQTTVYIVARERQQTAEWIHALGPARDNELRTLLPPVPSLNLRSLTAAPEEEVFLWTGATDISYLLGLYESYSRDARPAIPTVLDFGCGCGRLARYLDCSEQYTTFACDVNPDLVTWCTENLTNLEAFISGPLPPVLLSDNSIDFAFALSVFTHLSKSTATSWLAEFARILSPGGLLALTTHGYTALEIIKRSRIHQEMFGLDEPAVQSLIDRLGTQGHIFLPYGEAIVAQAHAGHEYGNAFLNPESGATLWSNNLEVVAHLPGGLRGWQDVFLLRKK